jgi:hypothetical protein
VRICSENTGQGKPLMNTVQLKMKLVEDLVGRNIDNLFESRGAAVEQHTPVHIEDGVWPRCAYCAVQMSRMRRTRYQCASCGVPSSIVFDCQGEGAGQLFHNST